MLISNKPSPGWHPFKAPAGKSGRWRGRLCYAQNLTSPPALEKPVQPAETVPSPSNDKQGFWNVVASSQAFAQQLLSHFPRWPGPQLVAEKVLQEASDKEREKQLNSVPADIRRYLHPTAVWEMKHIRKLCHLCSLTYKPHKVNAKLLKRCHNLDLVMSSWSSSNIPTEPIRTAEEVLAVGDGMGVSFTDVRNMYTSAEALDAMQFAKDSPVGLLPLVGQMQGLMLPDSLKKKVSPADAVAAKLAEAAMAATAAASAAAVPLASAAGSLYAGLAFLPIPSLGSSSAEGGKSLPAQSETLPPSSLVTEAAAPSSSSELPAPAAMQQATAAGISSSKPASSTPANVSPSSSVTSACPSEWFICDDPAHQLRIFVIQGSDTIDHWKLNLTFDPVTFEDPALGVTVHRGVYEAAKVLYEKFLTYIYEHLDSSPFAKVAFTGHSIGGSLGTLLMLMYKRRGVLTNRSIATVYTFGAPSVFCEGPAVPWVLGSAGSGDSLDLQDLVVHGGAAPASAGGSEGAETGPSRLLAALDLKDQAVRNVIMHRDIVPRAFACDYSLVADILRGWGAGFRDHSGLSGDGRKHLYYFVGRMMVLQPDPWHVFVNNDMDHPLLPPGPGLHYLAEPRDMLVPKPRPANGSTAESGLAEGQLPGAGAQRAAKVPATAREAVMELMDRPHPLETLADPAAYLDKGSISRYHNPDHYTLAFGRIISLRRQQERSSREGTGVRDLLGHLRRLQLKGEGMSVMDGDADRVSIWESSDEPVEPMGFYMESSLHL